MAYDRIYREALDKGFSTGTVHVYLMNPDGVVQSTLHVAHASVDALLSAMNRVAESSGVTPGEPLIKPSIQSKRPAAPTDSLVIHLVARGTGNGSWREFPSEDWLVFNRAESKGLLPASKPRTGESWEVQKPVAERLLRHFYPQTEQCDDEKPLTNRIDRMALSAIAESAKNGLVHARLEGSLRMKHAFYPGRDDDNFVDATLAGYLDYEPKTGRVRNLRLVTDEATYGKERIGIAASSVR